MWGRVGGISLGTANLVMVIFLRTAHFVLAAVDLVILTTMFLKVPSEGKGLGGLELILDSTSVQQREQCLPRRRCYLNI